MCIESVPAQSSLCMVEGCQSSDDVLYLLTVTQNCHKTFTRDVEITGNLDAELINGLRLRADVITLACNDKEGKYQQCKKLT
ncbi:hypothetical protein TNCV_3153961 [Trichonephila clavipes]|nr:hypothetical protein TNCV_3153961 [Trichonephila clavipes]